MRWAILVIYLTIIEPVVNPSRWAKYVAWKYGLVTCVGLLCFTLGVVWCMLLQHSWILFTLNVIRIPQEVLAVVYAMEDDDDDEPQRKNRIDWKALFPTPLPHLG